MGRRWQRCVPSSPPPPRRRRIHRPSWFAQPWRVWRSMHLSCFLEDLGRSWLSSGDEIFVIWDAKMVSIFPIREPRSYELSFQMILVVGNAWQKTYLFFRIPSYMPTWVTLYGYKDCLKPNGQSKVCWQLWLLDKVQWAPSRHGLRPCKVSWWCDECTWIIPISIFISDSDHWKTSASQIFDEQVLKLWSW